MITQLETTMHRDEYMNAADAETAHDTYYRQYVTADIRLTVSSCIGLKAITDSKDPRMNDIPLARWDSLVRLIPSATVKQLRANGDWLSLAVGVCILKAAARMIKEDYAK